MAGRRAPIALLSLALLAPAARAAPAGGPACGSTNPLTLVGIDTTTGRMLFAAPAVGPGDPWLVELRLDPGAGSIGGNHAVLYADPDHGRFGGSVGPGPILAARPCGATCLQPVRWSDGAWETVGEPLRVPTAATVSSTWDQAGVPWFLAQLAAKEEGSFQVEAFRLDGRDWKSHGTMTVSAMGQPSALPAPQRKDGILVGTGLFSASGLPEAWVAGVPSLPAARRGQLVALTGTSAAYLSADGVVYLSESSGKSWRRSTWTPWGTPEATVGMWRQGNDWWVDLPFGNHEGTLKLAWFDHRVSTEEKILLTRLGQNGQWARLAEARSEVRTRSESLPLSQILVPRKDTWILLSGCVASGGSSSLVLRVFENGALSEPKLVGLEPR